MNTSRHENHPEQRDNSWWGMASWRVVGFVGFFCILIWVMAMRCGLSTYFDPPSVGIACGVPVALLLCVYGGAGVGESVLDLFRRSTSWQNPMRSVSVFQVGAAVALLSGGIGTIIGMIATLANMDDPSRVGPGMAIALLTTLYGLVFGALLYIAAVILAGRIGASDAIGRLAKQGIIGSCVAVSVGIVSVMAHIGILLLLGILEVR